MKNRIEKFVSTIWDIILRLIKFLGWRQTKLETLNFDIEFHNPTVLKKIGLPVEIRRADFSLVKTGLTSKPVELEPGEYFVISELPAGQELLSRIEIKAGESNTALLEFEKGDESPDISEDIQHFHISNRQKVISVIEDSKSKEKEVPNVFFPTSVKLRVFTGNLLNGDLKQTAVDWQLTTIGDGLYGFEVHHTAQEFQIVQLLQTDAPPLNMILPALDGNDCRLFITVKTDGTYTIDAHLENQTADLLLRYSNKGFFRETELVGKELNAEKLLKSKVSDPIAAAVGAYALLHFSRLELLHDWTENLRQWFKWLPDGAAIRGEHLAQLGRHEEAFRVFLEIEKRGLPIFSRGLSYTVDRLLTYLAAEPDFLDVESEKLKNLLGKLKRFAAYTDFREPITTFTGLDLNNPSTLPIKKIPEDDKAIDLGKIISNKDDYQRGEK